MKQSDILKKLIEIGERLGKLECRVSKLEEYDDSIVGGVPNEVKRKRGRPKSNIKGIVERKNLTYS